MAALTEPRDTPARNSRLFAVPVAANVRILAGAFVAYDADGNAAPVSAVATLKGGAGRARETVDNRAGTAGAQLVTVERGLFRWSNAGDVTRANVLAAAYGVDDHTVTADGTGSRSAVGIIRDVDASGVWVEI